MPDYPSHFFGKPFAQDGDKTIISDKAPAKGRATLTEGFPPVTSQPIPQGGIAPNRLDFNGILNMLSALAWWQQSGGQWKYDKKLDYAPPALVFHDGKYWQCLKANNAAEPVAPGTNDTVWKALGDFLGLLKSLTLTGDATGTGQLVDSGITVAVDVNHADTADKWKQPLTMTFTGHVTGTATFDGSQNVSVKMTIDDFLPLTGGTITGPITWNDKILVNSVNGVAADENGNVDVNITPEIKILNTNSNDNSVTVPNGGRWAVVYFDWGTDWGFPYCKECNGGEKLTASNNKITALCIKIKEDKE